MVVQPGLCRTWSVNLKTVFLRCDSFGLHSLPRLVCLKTEDINSRYLDISFAEVKSVSLEKADFDYCLFDLKTETHSFILASAQ